VAHSDEHEVLPTEGFPRPHIDVSLERVRILIDRWAARWRRPPTNDELAGLIRQWIGDEILYREAIARGLDRDDELVRRRLVQKMYGIARGLSEVTRPAEADLRAFYADHPDRYVVPAQRSFRQVYVSTEQGDDAAEFRAAELLERLARTPPGEWSELGDPFVLADEFALLTAQDVTSRFGASFADELFELSAGGWAGPIRSSFGLHLVEVTSMVAASTPTFEEARERVRIDVDDQRAKAAEADLVAALASQYHIEYSWDDGDLQSQRLDGPAPIDDPDLLGTLAVLAPKQGDRHPVEAKLPRDEDGRPDWTRLMAEIHHTGAHGTIALAGGGPRRARLIELDGTGDSSSPGYQALAAEFARGLRATTGATIDDDRLGWVGLVCDSDDMAIWMVRALAAENITVRREGATVYLPASATYALEDEFLDMVIAAARSMHFFEDHIRVTDHEHE